MSKSPPIQPGTTFSLWTVVGPPQKKGHTYAYLCRCACGCEAVREGSLLRAGRTRGCRRCTMRGQERPASRLAYGESSRNEAIGCYRRNAKARGIAFELSSEEAAELFASNCHYCGSPPSNVMRKKRCFGEFVYSGMDRIDNDVGYVHGNVVACCSTCNMAKSGATTSQFLAWARRVAERHPGLETTGSYAMSRRAERCRATETARN